MRSGLRVWPAMTWWLVLLITVTVVAVTRISTSVWAQRRPYRVLCNKVDGRAMGARDGRIGVHM